MTTTPTVHDIADLMRDLPGPETTPTDRAAWLERKLVLLARIAASN